MSSRQTEFRRQLDALPSWKERAQKIDERLEQTRAALLSRSEKLLGLCDDFNALAIDFWYAFRLRKREGDRILAKSQQPFWMTRGSIALSNMSITPPAGAKWWTPERTTFVFVRHAAVRFIIDAITGELLWENPSLTGDFQLHNDDELCASVASQILRNLLAIPQHQQLVSAFEALACLDGDITFLQSLEPEIEKGLAEELRTAEQRVTDLRATITKRYPQTEQKAEISAKAVHGSNGTNGASWDTLVIPQGLRENLQAYCRILRDYEAYRSVGVHLPKGLLFHGPPGCGKTQIAKTLSAEAGLNFLALFTSDCKQMWIGWSADRLATVFNEARSKQPSLIFIDELDAVCPPRGVYHDAISQEFTAQLLQEVDGLLSDTQAIFLVSASNRPDQIDSAILSRFTEQIEIPLPDATTRTALLDLFLRPLRFSGDRAYVIRALALATKGQSGP
jgi:hypothetical protein